MSEKIIKNASKGYGYNYASLADMARQGVEIPKMTTKLIDGFEYVFYKDGEDWLQGARVVVEFEAKGMNSAQAYGSSLTYARRYTVALANGIATDDDDAVEMAKPRSSGFSEPSKPSDKQLNFIKTLAKMNGKTDDEIETLLRSIKDAKTASAVIKKMKGED